MNRNPAGKSPLGKIFHEQKFVDKNSVGRSPLNISTIYLLDI